MATDRARVLVPVLLLALLAACGSDGVVVKNSYMRGVDRYDDGDYHEAIREYQAALADDPSDHRVWFNLGLCYHELYLAADEAEKGAWLAKAEEAYAEAAKMTGGESRARLARARLHWDSGQRDAALAELDGMTGDDAIGAGAPAATRAAMLAAAGRAGEAESEYRRALALEEHHEPAVAALAALLVAQGRDAEAETVLDPAIEKHRYDLTLRALKAGILERRAEGSGVADDWLEARRAWEQAEAFAAGDWEIAVGLARCSAKLGEPIGAVRNYWYALDNASDLALRKRGHEPATWRAAVRKELLALYPLLPEATRAEAAR